MKKFLKAINNSRLKQNEVQMYEMYESVDFPILSSRSLTLTHATDTSATKEGVLNKLLNIAYTKYCERALVRARVRVRLRVH